MTEREYAKDSDGTTRPVVIGTAENPVMLGFTDAEIERVREANQRDQEKFGKRHQVEIVSTHDLKPGDLVWTGQDFNIVRDTKLESELEGESRMEDQCAVLWRALPDPNKYNKQGYTIFGDVILRVIP